MYVTFVTFITTCSLFCTVVIPINRIGYGHKDEQLFIAAATWETFPVTRATGFIDDGRNSSRIACVMTARELFQLVIKGLLSHFYE
jgi:hypothetical protein